MRKLMLALVVFGAALASVAATPTKAQAWWRAGYYSSYYYPRTYIYGW